jgi:hypothetical protein
VPKALIDVFFYLTILHSTFNLIMDSWWLALVHRTLRQTSHLLL